ncbi:metallophosphoesterase 1-like [Scleropages formosus]|uniref:Metallophosphoesterase 1 n=1 Tax=Scleropages formosus TaxID=113540 RepID=A0A0P7UCX1_SCLFO|nr:metallophosphoesterase 1-like [Scleropages formosus]
MGRPGSRRWGSVLFLVSSACSAFIFCEYFIYFPVILRCSWPHAEWAEAEESEVLRVFILSDTHLLGVIRGHWFDKLRREWQMERAFQTALWHLRPQVVFILGDVFDEGKWSSPEDWEDDVRRFQHMFRHPNNTELIVLVGNHDVGFHHEMSSFKLQRFEKVFGVNSARIFTKKGINFLLVNSVAMQGDGCPICHAVENKLLRLSRELSCSMQSLEPNGEQQQCRGTRRFPPSPPVLLQHYPLYRGSDANCTGQDAALPQERHLLFQERYDVLSKAASRKWFQPRLILSGHTHSGCEVLHEEKHPEISVPSFSWRNRNNPSFILGIFSSSHFALSKCFLPQESTVIAIYATAGVTAALLPLVHWFCFKGSSLMGLMGLMGKHKSL